jgi:histone-lysine N-methyltransferase SETMAR
VPKLLADEQKIKQVTCHAVATQDLFATFGWQQFDHPRYSPDLALNDFHVFLHLKTFLGGRRFHDNNEVKSR